MYKQGTKSATKRGGTMLILTSAGENGGTKFFLEGEHLEAPIFKSLKKVAQFIVNELPETANLIVTDYRNKTDSEVIHILIHDKDNFLNELKEVYVKEYDDILSANEGEEG
ncbi:MAG: hypothetical protein WC523_02630 [Patescibacteria group bacterium]